MASFELFFIGILVLLQVYVFINVFRKINRYKSFFPNSFKEITTTTDKLSETEEVEILHITEQISDEHPDFTEVVKSTNAYLMKNKGAAADFNILKDTCERHVEKIDNEIGNLINVPLYIGLGGTFVGIIIGLIGIDFSATTVGTTTRISSESIDQLLNGVVAAMVASLIGLVATVVLTAIFYKPAAFKNDTGKNDYYDFIQRELLPYLNTGISKSLTNFRDVLNHFIIKFGENMTDYKDSGQLLNDNLQKQQTVLEELNKLSLTKTATSIANTFVNLKESSEHLAKFQTYQSSLNNYVDKTEKVANEMNTIIDQFKNFNNNLQVISNDTIATLELQRQFKDSLEKHFPVIKDHREVWRTQVDELNQDIKEVYKELNNYFKTSTEQIQTFIGSNNNFFTGINEIQNAIKIFVENSSIQKDEFNVLKNQIVDMRNDFKDSQKQSIETNKALIDAIIDLKKTISKIEIPTEK